MLKKNDKIIFLTIISNILVFQITANATKTDSFSYIKNLEVNQNLTCASDNNITIKDENLNQLSAIIKKENDSFSHSKDLIDLKNTIENIENKNIQNINYNKQLYDETINVKQHAIDTKNLKHKKRKKKQVNAQCKDPIKFYNKNIKKMEDDIEVLKQLKFEKYKNLNFDTLKILDKYSNNKEKISKKTNKYINRYREFQKKNANYFVKIKPCFKKKLRKIKNKVSNINSFQTDISNVYKNKVKYYNEKMKKDIINKSLINLFQNFDSKINEPNDQINSCNNLYLTFINKQILIKKIKEDLQTCKNFTKKYLNKEKFNLKEFCLYTFYNDNKNKIIKGLKQLKLDIKRLKKIKSFLSNKTKKEAIDKNIETEYKNSPYFKEVINKIINNVENEKLEEQIDTLIVVIRKLLMN